VGAPGSSSLAGPPGYEPPGAPDSGPPAGPPGYGPPAGSVEYGQPGGPPGSSPPAGSAEIGLPGSSAAGSAEYGSPGSGPPAGYGPPAGVAEYGPAGGAPGYGAPGGVPEYGPPAEYGVGGYGGPGGVLEAATPPVPDRPAGARVDDEASVAGRIRHGDSVGRRAFGAVRGLVGGGAEKAMASAVVGVRTPVPSGRRIAVVSARGGSGKSTVAALLGIVFGMRRPDRVLALDAELGLGSLAHRLGMPVGRTLAHVGPYVLTGQLSSGTQIEQAIPRHPSGLWVLPGPPPDLAAGIPATGPVDTAKALERHFGVTIMDCAAGLGGDTNIAAVTAAHAVVFVTHASVEGVRSAEAGLHLLGQSVPDFPGHAIAVLVSMNPRTEGLDLARAQAALRPMCADVVRLPYDRHLAAGGSIHIDQVGATTTVVATALAASALTIALAGTAPPPPPDPYQQFDQPYDPAPPYGPPQSYTPPPYDPGGPPPQPAGLYEPPHSYEPYGASGSYPPAPDDPIGPPRP
jgi:MinD-like ATPase involved in chromosome partitioning or flagellar assembly